MIPRLGDGNQWLDLLEMLKSKFLSLENDSPSRGRKPTNAVSNEPVSSLENDSPSRGRKPNELFVPAEANV